MVDRAEQSKYGQAKPKHGFIRGMTSCPGGSTGSDKEDDQHAGRAPAIPEESRGNCACTVEEQSEPHQRQQVFVAETECPLPSKVHDHHRVGRKEKMAEEVSS